MRITTRSNLQELRSHGTLGFPFDIYYVTYEERPNQINNHWHTELEITYVLQGSIIARVNGVESVIHAGEAIFINSNALHMTQILDSENETSQYTIVFSPLILAGVTSNIYQKYVAPYLRNPNCSSVIIVNEEQGRVRQQIQDEKQNDSSRLLQYTNESHSQSSQMLQHAKESQSRSSQMLQYIKEICEIYAQHRNGFELQIHTLLCQLWQILIQSEFHNISQNQNDIQLERTRNMLSFLQESYMNDISIQDIAEAASISRSECFRCFQKILGQKPFEYLIDLRLEKAAALLLNTNDKISDIGIQCGMNQQSYFGKLFKERYGMTPLEYRKRAM